MDNQREAAFSALVGIAIHSFEQRPAPKEWSLGEILDHSYLLMAHPRIRL
ncbi:MAG: hypothetical protein M0C28_36880 [Candidatus Moduliflexus flocculans]|nr:hypothetical protein [Candidatus Moduliflexus flocculans]